MMQTAPRNQLVTTEQERKVWSIHRAVNGMTYYYNRSTKKSQYEMPECFKTTEEILEHPEWREYRTAEGKKFYYNSVTKKSVWQVPNEVKEWRAKIEEAKQAEQARREEDGQQQTNVSDEQKKKFISLLKDKHIDMNCKWDACITRCEEDERWRILRTSEKRRLFQEYINETRKQDQLLKRAKLEAHKADFLKMLMECKTLTSDCKMHKMVAEFLPDRRWRALDEMERENVYQMYMDELMYKEREEAKMKAKENMDALKRALEEANVSSKTKWDTFRDMFSSNEYYRNLNNLDRLTAFSEYIKDLQKKEEEDQQGDKQARERNNRQSFRQLVAKRIRSGQVNYKTRWPKFVRQNREERALIDMMDDKQQGSSAHELFEDAMEGIRENHRNFKTLIKTYFKTSNFRMTSETTQAEFEEKLQGVQQYWNLKPLVRDYLYSYFKNKIKSNPRKAQKREKKAMMKVFRQIKEIRAKSTLAEHLHRIHEEIRNSGELGNGTIPLQTIEKYFDQYITSELAEENDKKKRRERSETESDDSSEEERRKKKKKDRKRNVSESSDQEEEVQKPSKKKKEERKQQKKAEKPEERKEEKAKSTPIPTAGSPGVIANDFEEEGEIKDEEIVVEQKQKSSKKEKSSKRKHKKSRRRNSDSSDSD